jgi:hypothetical protein
LLELEKETRISSVQCVPVDHCPNSFGVKVEIENDLSVM